MAIAQTEMTDTWQQYRTTNQLELKQDLMLHYMWVVKYVLQKTNLPTNSILDEGDFLNIGMLGLNEAIERFDIERGVKFESYAIPRIKGTIQDELRKLDWLSRSTRKKAQDFLNTKDKLNAEAGREVSVEEIMEKLQVTPDNYKKYLNAAASARSFLSMNDSNFFINEDDEMINVLEEIAEDDEDNFLNIALEKERMDFLVQYLEHLDQKKRLVMVLYYYEDRTFKEIGADIGISESRVCQIHSQVINDLRDKFKEYNNA
ncbi:MAG: FliA/WhiG family RNA polymerase sigma factor [Ignavibacteria bacterium]|jgi:RNA polymerase sigma factor for flagellar operon FliA|nr:FliA/WhiG family RNA polymerase sigma factor [Ignavibacteria bacterium]